MMKKSSRSTAEDEEGQGQLYSPEYAIKVNTQEQEEEQQRRSKGGVVAIAADIRKSLGNMKERLLEKLAAAAVPADALENARHFLETVVRDVTAAAQGLTKDALLRIKSQLVELLPSLSPSLTRKMVDEAAKEVKGESGENKDKEEGEEDTKASSFKPSSKL